VRTLYDNPLARGFHDWFFHDIRAGRVAWPRA